jgi:hypothetical protein
MLCPRSIPKTKADAKPDPKSGLAPVSWEEWRQAAQRGHEVANHGWSHLAGKGWTTPETAWNEVVQARRVIETETGRPVVAFVYPFNSALKPDNPLYAAYIKTHLIWSGGGRLWYGGNNWTLASANAKADELIAAKAWAVTMIHGIKAGYSPFKDPEEFHEHLKYLKSKEASLWVAPLGAAARYLMEARACKLEARPGPSQATFTLTCPLDPRIYDAPLTVVVDAPSATQAAARQGEKALEARVHGGTIRVDVVPGDTPVTVQW